MPTPTLVFSSVQHSRNHILSTGIDEHVNTLFDKIFRKQRSERVEIRNGHYHYSPSEEWRTFTLSFRRVKKY